MLKCLHRLSAVISLKNREPLSVDDALAENYSPDIIRFWVKSLKAKRLRIFVVSFSLSISRAERFGAPSWTQLLSDGFFAQDVINIHFRHKIRCSEYYNKDSGKQMRIQIEYKQFHWFYCPNHAVQLHFSNFLREPS